MRLTLHKSLPAASIIISLLALYYKRPDAFTNPQLYAEEGIYFFSDAYHQGFKSLFNTCAGYFHLYPRLIFCTFISLGFPMDYIPAVCTYSWLFVFGIVLLYIWQRVELDNPRKFFMAIGTVLLPLQAEMLMNLTNVQWVMALLPMIIFSATDSAKNKKWFWADMIVLLLTGFTGPNLIILLPVVLLLAVKQRTNFLVNRQRLAFLLIVAMSVLISTLAIIRHGSIDRSEGTFSITNPAFIEYIYLQYAFIFLGKFAYDTPWLIKCLFILLLLAYAIYVTIRIIKGKEQRTFTIVTFFAGILYFVTTLISYRHDPSILHPYYGAVRNFFLPAVCCVWYFISVIRPINNPVPVLFCLMWLFVCENLRCIGRERFIDYHWENYTGKITTADTLTIPVNPEGFHLFIDNRNKKTKSYYLD